MAFFLPLHELNASKLGEARTHKQNLNQGAAAACRGKHSDKVARAATAGGVPYGGSVDIKAHYAMRSASNTKYAIQHVVEDHNV